MATDDAEAEVRIAGIRELLASIESGAVDNEEEARFALVARVSDASAEVLDALYASPTVLLSIVPLATFVSAIIETIERAEIAGQELPRAVLRYHLNFVGQYGTAADVRLVFWRWILLAGSRKKRATLAWDVLADVKKERLELFQGCAGLALDKNDDGVRNLLIAKRIAGSWLRIFQASQMRLTKRREHHCSTRIEATSRLCFRDGSSRQLVWATSGRSCPSCTSAAAHWRPPSGLESQSLRLHRRH